MSVRDYLAYNMVGEFSYWRYPPGLCMPPSIINRAGHCGNPELTAQTVFFYWWVYNQENPDTTLRQALNAAPAKEQVLAEYEVSTRSDGAGGL